MERTDYDINLVLMGTDNGVGVDCGGRGRGEQWGKMWDNCN